MKEVKKVKHLGMVLFKQGEISYSIVKGRSVIGELARVTKRRNVSTVEKRGQRNSIFLPTLMYGSAT